MKSGPDVAESEVCVLCFGLTLSAVEVSGYCLAQQEDVKPQGKIMNEQVNTFGMTVKLKKSRKAA